ncbi:MAG TPA: DUF2259 domain-containing protein [Nannocystis sp.]|jgi:hypothetical protein
MSPRKLALTILAATACGAPVSCGAPVVQPLDEAKRPEPPRKDTKDSKTADPATPAAADPAAPATPEPEKSTQPYTRAGDPKDQRDELRFWGFSEDGTKYAFETYYHGAGGAQCEGQASLFIVDADSDSFVEDSPLVIKHKQPDAERCDPPDLRAEMDRHREQLLHRHAIVVGNQGAPIVPAPAVDEKGKARASTIALPSGTLRAEVEVIDGDREKVGERGAAYKLTLVREGQPPKLIEPGTRRRPFVWDYNLDEGVVFVAPDARHLAIVLGTAQRSFEGDRHSYMSNGVKLPDGW